MPEQADIDCYLESALGKQNALRVAISHFPFVIGRSRECDLPIASIEMSRRHAELTYSGQYVYIQDLGSTNGTFVNREPIHQVMVLHNGDIIHFGKLEFRIRIQTDTITDNDVNTQSVTLKTFDFDEDTDSIPIYRPETDLSGQFVSCEKEFYELLHNSEIEILYQPIVRLKTRELIAYEVLGRGKHCKVPTTPYELFKIAEKLGREIELSQIFRLVGALHSKRLKGLFLLFFNTHPSELEYASLIDSLEQIQNLVKDIKIVLELHETAVTRLQFMKTFVKQLHQRNIALAYDDFGAGQSRLNELAEVPPDYLKFDKSLIQNLPNASSEKQNLVRMLVELSKNLGIITVAEGIETQQEADLCRLLGFELGQGFYYGKPEVIS